MTLTAPEQLSQSAHGVVDYEDRSRVLIVDDHGLVAESLRLTLRGRGFDASTVSNPTPESVDAALEEHRPDIVLMDLDLGCCTGLDLLPAVIARGVRVIMLTGVRDRLKLAACLEAGASGLANKDGEVTALVQQVEMAVRGDTVFPVSEREQMLVELRAARAEESRRRRQFEDLTSREREVLGALARGAQVAQIARDSYVSVTTVRGHVNAILRKLGVSSQLAAVAMANGNGWPLG